MAALPLLGTRRYPAVAPAAVAIVTLVTQLSVGPLVTCGVVVPTAYLMAFQIGSRLMPAVLLAAGGFGVLATLAIELVLDPALGTPDAAIFVLPLGATFFVGGWVVRSRVRTADKL